MNQMSNDKMREEFLCWVSSRKLVTRNNASLRMNSDETQFLDYRVNDLWFAWQASREAESVRVWQGIDTCPQHTEVLFYRSDAGVFSGMITDADHFMSEKERDEWTGTEQEMFDLDAFGFGDWGVCRCDGTERPTHWMPLPVEPEVKP